MALMTTLGLLSLENNLFDEMQVPEQIDKEVLTDYILSKVGNLEVFYPDASFMKKAIGFWSKARLNTWQKMAGVLFEDYDPFINIKRDEVRTITETHDLQATNDTTQNAAAWNDTDPVEVGNSNSQGHNTGTVTTTDHFHVEGDSAITDAQDVLKKEMQVRKEFNLYDIIANEYKTEFCLLVY